MLLIFSNSTSAVGHANIVSSLVIFQQLSHIRLSLQLSLTNPFGSVLWPLRFMPELIFIHCFLFSSRPMRTVRRVWPRSLVETLWAVSFLTAALMSSLLLLVSKIKDMPQLNSVFVGSNRFVLPALAKEQFLVMFFFFLHKTRSPRVFPDS